jgi:hypothetical protein
MSERISRTHAFVAVSLEREHQEQKWGAEKPQSLPGFLLVLESELEEAKRAWTKNHTAPRQSVMEEIVQIAAVAVAAIERYGAEGCPVSTNDEVVG